MPKAGKLFYFSIDEENNQKRCLRTLCHRRIVLLHGLFLILIFYPFHALKVLLCLIRKKYCLSYLNMYHQISDAIQITPR